MRAWFLKFQYFDISVWFFHRFAEKAISGPSLSIVSTDKNPPNHHEKDVSQPADHSHKIEPNLDLTKHQSNLSLAHHKGDEFNIEKMEETIHLNLGTADSIDDKRALLKILTPFNNSQCVDLNEIDEYDLK